MTRALLTPALNKEINKAGFFLVIDAGGLTLTLYRSRKNDKNGMQRIGTLSYRSSSVDYDALMGLIREAA